MRGLLAVLLALASGTAIAQTPLKSFSYVSTHCYSGGDTLAFGADSFKMTAVKPGAGDFPAGNFWIRQVSLTFFGEKPRWRDMFRTLIPQWAVVGHSGSDGDWITPPVISGTTRLVTYAADVAPLFRAGEYLDVHAGCRPNSPLRAIVSVWYVPAP